MFARSPLKLKVCHQLAISIAVFFGARSECFSASITGLGFYSFGTPGNLSGDGKTIVGSALVGSEQQAFKWTQAEGRQLLGQLHGGNASFARAVNYDGSVVVGNATYLIGSTTATEAFRWTPSSGLVGLGFFSGSSILNTTAYAVNADGNVVVGGGISSRGNTAFRWTTETGLTAIADSNNGYIPGRATAVSGNGQRIYGQLANKDVFAWTATDGTTDLGRAGPLGALSSFSLTTNSDGSVLAGWDFAFRWSQASGFTLLNSVNRARVFDMTPDGKTIVGSDFTDSVACMWTNGGIYSTLTDVLIAGGVDPSAAGWSSLSTISGISDDGTVITGLGIRTNGVSEAFVATIPEPTTLTMMSALSGTLF